MSHPLDRSVRIAHRTVLAMIVVCGVISWVQPHPAEEPAPDPLATTAAVALALAVILLRGSARSRVLEARSRLVLLLSAYACGFALALVGALLALTASQPRTGLAFALGAGILCMRPPGPLGRGD